MDTFINVHTGEYPLTLDDIHGQLKRVSLPINPTAAQLLRYGYCRVQPTDKPNGYKVVESKPRFNEGRFYQTWKIEQLYNVEQLQLSLRNELEKHFNNIIRRGHALGDNRYLNIEDNDDLSFVFLECLMLKDEDSKETVSLVLVDGEKLAVTYREAIPILRTAIRHKRALHECRKMLLRQIDTVSTEEEYRSIKQHIVSGEVVL